MNRVKSIFIHIITLYDFHKNSYMFNSSEFLSKSLAKEAKVVRFNDNRYGYRRLTVFASRKFWFTNIRFLFPVNIYFFVDVTQFLSHLLIESKSICASFWIIFVVLNLNAPIFCLIFAMWLRNTECLREENSRPTHLLTCVITMSGKIRSMLVIGLPQ